MKKNTVVYARGRREDKKKADLIIEKQLTSTRNYCKDKGCRIVKEFWDYSSARNFDRKYYQKMKTFITTNKNNVDLLLFDHWDRFSRNNHLAFNEIKYYKILGIEVRSVEQNSLHDSPQIMRNIFQKLNKVWRCSK